MSMITEWGIQTTNSRGVTAIIRESEDTGELHTEETAKDEAEDWSAGIAVVRLVTPWCATVAELKAFRADGADGADEVGQVREIHDALPFAHFMEGRLVDIVDRLRQPSFHHMAIMDEAADLIVEMRESLTRLVQEN